MTIYYTLPDFYVPLHFIKIVMKAINSRKVMTTIQTGFQTKGNYL